MNLCFCGGTTAPASFLDQFFGRPLRRCVECDTMLIERIPGPGELETFYSGAYSEERNSFVGEAYLAVMRRRAAAQVSFIARHIRLQGAHVLDQGCGYGMLLDALRDAGAITAGFDHDPLCREALSRNGHEIAPPDPIDSEREWDLVCFSHVVEHLPDPIGLLAQLRTKARHVFVEVPRYASSRVEAFADQEGHLWFLTPRGAEALVTSAGWRILESAAAGPALGLYWSGGAVARLTRRARRMLSKDLFFGQYERQSADGMWIRIMAERAA